MSSHTDNPVTLQLTRDEALVALGWLSRFSETDRLSIDDPSERRMLWNLCCLLEKQLEEPFQPNGRELLEAAQARLRDEPTTAIE